MAGSVLGRRHVAIHETRWACVALRRIRPRSSRVEARAIRSWSVLWVVFAGAGALHAARPGEELFEYDQPAKSVSATLADNPEFYDADVLDDDRIGLMLTWLEFVPGEGDFLWTGCFKDGAWSDRIRLNDRPGQFAKPTLTRDETRVRTWLTYEQFIDGQWDVIVMHRDHDADTWSEPIRVSTSPGPDIDHCATGTFGGIWVAWQSARDGQFDVMARFIEASPDEAKHVTAAEREGPVLVSVNSPRGDWHPSLCTTVYGILYVVWDGHDGESYNVLARSRRPGAGWGDVFTVAATPAFEGRPAVVHQGGDGAVVAWEEGSQNWGRPYTSRMRLKSPDSLEMTDASGPLHRVRKLRVAAITPDGTVRKLKHQPPMPSIDKALVRPDRPEGVGELGAFYERPQLAIGPGRRLWLFYRHRYGSYIGMRKTSHVEADWAIDARCLTPDGWSDLHRLDIGQGDGMQRLALASTADGIAAVWTTGRTDREQPDRPRGIATATLVPSSQLSAAIPLGTAADSDDQTAQPNKPAPVAAYAPKPDPITVGGKTYHLFFGDLHRHTDFSRCYSVTDGTLDDVYRYASDVAELDFLGVTDHSRDLAMGNARSQLWWRCVKEVTRHELAPRFIPLFAYERSRGGEDHNVISLRSDMLRPYTYPHPEFWKELDDDTFTIPHQTITAPIPPGGPQPLGLDPKTWDRQDNARRPLLEIYQGCRDRAIERDAREGLSRGHLLGFIASSDHLSTSHGYACVWAESRTRESIFRAMQARRTFGATAPIRLAVRAADHWMGESFDAKTMPALQIDATGTADVASIDVFIDGEQTAALPQSARAISLTYEPPPLPAGTHYLYIRLNQTDSHRAWSSPLWITLQPDAPPAQSDATQPPCCPDSQGPVPGT